MAFRDFILSNFKWKLGALSMAMFVWFIIQIALSRGFNPTEHPLSDVRTRIFFRQPVLVAENPDDPHTFKITPAKVDVTIRSTSSALNKLTENDIKAFVSLAGDQDEMELTREVLVYVPKNVDIDSIKVEPPAVTVVRLAKPE